MKKPAVQNEEQLDRRVRRTKRLLKEAFIQLMSEKDYEQISVTDIVVLADYNRATFYRHYQHKDELVYEIIDDRTKGLIQALRYPYLQKNYIHLNTMSPDEITVFNHIIENESFYRLWGKFATISGFVERYLDALSTYFKNEIVLLTNPQEGLNNNLYTSFYAYGILGLILDWIKSDLKQSPEYMAKQLCKILNYYPAESYLRDLREDT